MPRPWAILGRMSDLPFELAPGPAALLVAAIDRERKVDRALEALGPLAGRDVVAIRPGPDETARWTAAGARLRAIDSLLENGPRATPDASADTIVSTWAGFRGMDPAELAAADRVLRPGGRLLVVHDYGR